MFITRIIALVTLLAAAFAPASVPAQPPWTAPAVLSRIEARNPAMRTFKTRVHIDAHLRTFPFFSSRLDGTWYYKRPGKYELVLDRSPSYAKGVKSLFADIADPIAWQRDSNIVFDGVKTVGGNPFLTLRMTKKVYSDQIRDTIAYIDPATFEIVRMDWNYRDGSTNTMTQTYGEQNGFTVPVTAHADIHHRMRAALDATYGAYQTNIAVSDAVFQRK
jgi:hypothetical protein